MLQPLKRPRRTIRSFAAAGALAFALAMLNVAAAWMLPAQIDLTRKGSFTLAPQTRNVLAPLEEPLEVTLLAPRVPKTADDAAFARATPSLRELLEQFRELQPRLRVREFDPTEGAQGRELLGRFPEARAPCAVIQYSGRHEVLTAQDLSEFHAAGPGRPAALEFCGEAAFTAAIARLSRGESQMVLYVLAGHGELRLDDDRPQTRDGISQLSQRLKELDIEVRTLDLRASTSVPADADLLLIAGGETQPALAEIDAIRRYLAHGGRVLMLCDLNLDPLQGGFVPCGWQPLLTELGVLAGDDRVVTRGFSGRLDAASPALPAGGDHALVRSLSKAPVLLYECRSLRRLNDVAPSAWTVEPILVSYPAPEAWADGDADSGDEPTPDGDHDLNGPVGMAVCVERRRGDQNLPALVVVGDAEFVSNAALSQPAGRSGAAFALACINWLRGRRDLLGDIPPRLCEGYVLPGTPDRHRALVWAPTLVLSALIVTAGTSVWVSRRE